MPIFSYGVLDKKLLLVAIIIIFKIIKLIIEYEVSEDYINDKLLFIEEEIGPIIASIILYFTFKNKKKKKKETKNNIKYIIFLFIFRLIEICHEFFTMFIPTNGYYNFDEILNTVNGVEIILISFSTSLILKYKYYRHHFISMIIFCILGITIDFILKHFYLINYTYTAIYIFVIINEIILYSYLKYMMDKLYYRYVDIIFIWGIIGLIIKIGIILGLSIYQYINEIDDIFIKIYDYFIETNTIIIIVYQFLYYIFDSAIYYSSLILLLYYLKPNHIIITDDIDAYSNVLLYNTSSDKWYTIIPFILQILSLLFYFEILEFNFWNLNKNTIKNILKREAEELDGGSSYQSEIGINDQYYLTKKDLKINNDEEKENVEIEKSNSLIDEDLDIKTLSND